MLTFEKASSCVHVIQFPVIVGPFRALYTCYKMSAVQVVSNSLAVTVL